MTVVAAIQRFVSLLAENDLIDQPRGAQIGVRKTWDGDISEWHAGLVIVPARLS